MPEPWLPPSALAAALNTLNPRAGAYPLLLSLHRDTAGALVAVEEGIDPDAWAHLGYAGTLGWVAGGLARTPWTLLPPAGFCLIAERHSGPLLGWAADRNGGIYELTVNVVHGLRIRHYLTAGPARRSEPLPYLPRALAAVALAAAGHHPGVPGQPPNALLVGGSADLYDDLEASQTRYQLHHYERRTPPLEEWAAASLVFVATDAADRCRDLPLRPDVIYLPEAGVPGSPSADGYVAQLDAMAVARRHPDRWRIQWLPGAQFGTGR
ncbi:hypothetical protein [Cryptosporangium phraense]|uniref:Uncharacterized protein n=1 Tax=Cryptosporangium phraense TaxID=2593070 RepID=A0A545ANA9_9ACTN|nr:hypothetical protein [Cryptosporangium phraense]TQS42829.1 hypothetical protein FL583_22520 [Cryptosporangium phraense]